MEEGTGGGRCQTCPCHGLFVPFAASQLRADEASLLPEGKVKVKLDHDGAVLDVDEDDVEKVGALGPGSGWWGGAGAGDRGVGRRGR